MSVTKTWVRTDRKGNEEEWSWEETPALLSALANYYELVRKNNETIS